LGEGQAHCNRYRQFCTGESSELAVLALAYNGEMRREVILKCHGSRSGQVATQNSITELYKVGLKDRYGWKDVKKLSIHGCDIQDFGMPPVWETPIKDLVHMSPVAHARLTGYRKLCWRVYQWTVQNFSTSTSSASVRNASTAAAFSAI
jgi:hypothetical protein